MRLKVIVLGARGQLGTDICNLLKRNDDHEVCEVNRDLLSVEDHEEVDVFFQKHKPDVVINTTAFHNVPKCEQDLNYSFEVNAFAPLNMAKLSKSLGFHLIHISTDYVFDGKKPYAYEEDDVANPINVYGNSKLSGENFILANTDHATIIRTTGLYGSGKGHTNFVKKILARMESETSAEVVDDEVLTPTPTIEVAKCIAYLIKNPVYGIVHATSEGSCSWFEFACAINDIVQGEDPKFDFSIYKAIPGKYSNGVNRPKYSVLENKVLKNKGYEFPHWKVSLRKYIEEDM